MNWKKRFTTAWTGLGKAVSRYPLTLIFLVAGAIVNAMAIEDTKTFHLYHGKLLAAFIVGAFLATLAQVIYEKIGGSAVRRLILEGVSALLAAGYLWIIWGTPEIGIEILVRTAALLSAIIIGIIWVPSIKGKVGFNDTFMGAFKAIFISLFFSGVIFGGIAIIIGAVDLLLFNVDSTAYSHTANMVFILFAPIYFLSLIPNYQTAEDDVVERTIACPRFLEILISNILIPLISVFTVILVVYIGLNVRGDFWTENLIEPMLVSYSIVVIVIMLLSANLDNRLANLFRKIFPKVLLPLVALQLVASILKIGDLGLTHSRYYVIMYGIFAAAAGFVFSFLKPTKTGIIAMILIGFSLLSTLPPVDAFSVSRRSQISTLENVLEKNGMIENNKILPKSDLSKEDKDIIINTTQYIWRMDYSKDVAWLGTSFDYYGNFEKTFGFQWDAYAPDGKLYKIFNRNQLLAIDISGYDGLAYLRYYSDEPKNNLTETTSFVHEGETYRLSWSIEGEKHRLNLQNENNDVLASFDFTMVKDRLDALVIVGGMERSLSNEEATFMTKNDEATMKVIIENYEMSPSGKASEDWMINSEFYVLISLKK